MLSNPFERVTFRNEALDYFGFAIGLQNINPPASSGIFPSRKGWYLLQHPSEYAPVAARFKAAILPQSNLSISGVPRFEANL